MSKPNYFGGLEGFTAKIIAFVITLIFFSIYAATLGGFSASWFELSGLLLLFWVVYEIIGYVLFVFFNFFARNKFSKYEKNTTAEAEKGDEDMITIEEK